MNAATRFVRLSIGAILVVTAGCATEADKSSGPAATAVAPTLPMQASFIPVPSITLPAPPTPRGAEPGISQKDAGFAETELPTLLGYLWYPDAQISLCSHSQRNHGRWSLVTLIFPSDEKPRDIINYYETRFPGGERKGNSEYTFSTKRIGDEHPVQAHLFRATDGSEATRFVIRIRVII